MYSPIISKKNVSKLYLLKLLVRKPMTKLVEEAVEAYLSKYPELNKEAENE